MLVLCVLYDTFSIYSIPGKNLRESLTGILVGFICIAVMLNPWSLERGLYFDTRWVLLSLCGFYFGLVPTLYAVVIAGAFRLYQGGPGGIVGTVVIVTTACAGLAWKQWQDKRDKPINLLQLYIFGVFVQLVMLSCMFIFPVELRNNIFKKAALPILLIYPILTTIIGLILKKQEARRIADRELLYSTSLASAALESSPDGILIVSRDGKITRWNQKFIELWHVPLPLLDKPSNAHLREHVASQMTNPEEFLEKVAELYEHPEKTSVDTLYLADGRIFFRHSQPQRVGNEIVGRFWSFHDITERKSAEEERLKFEQQLLHAQKLESLGVLAGGIAHDFNNILTSIIGNADLALIRINPESPAIDNLRSIEKAAARAADLSKQMLAYSGKGRFVVSNHDCNDLLEEMLHILKVSISKKAVLRLNLTRPLPLVEADATQLRQIIMNLVINASEAIGDKSGIIAITTGCMDCDRSYLKDVWLDENLGDGLFVFIEIADTGCGMSKETMTKLFDPFFTTKFTGRGLGMAAVLGIVRGHKGAIKVYSEPGKGSTFKILLPASGRPAEIFNRDTLNNHWRGTGTVLLVDDEETVRGIGVEMLKELGFNVVTANDGREAVELYKTRNDFVFVLLDLTMPHMDGEQCFRELRALNPDVKVIISSGFSEHEVEQKFVGKGLAGFVQKPYKLSVLRDCIVGLYPGSKQALSSSGTTH
jgi:PAS domain S-box-containing protein